MILDTFIALIVGYALFKGFKNGLVVSLLSLVSLFAGIYVALKFSYIIKDVLVTEGASNEYTIGLIAFVFTFLLVLIGLHFLGKLLTTSLRVLALGFVNKIGGAVFEVLKMVLILSVFFNVFEKINIKNLLVSEEKMKSSQLYYPIQYTASYFFPMLENGWNWAVQSTQEIK